MVMNCVRDGQSRILCWELNSGSVSTGQAFHSQALVTGESFFKGFDSTSVSSSSSLSSFPYLFFATKLDGLLNPPLFPAADNSFGSPPFGGSAPLIPKPDTPIASPPETAAPQPESPDPSLPPHSEPPAPMVPSSEPDYGIYDPTRPDDDLGPIDRSNSEFGIGFTYAAAAATLVATAYQYGPILLRLGAFLLLA